jgi:hypothetical protein
LKDFFSLHENFINFTNFITSRPSQTSRLLTSSLYLGVPVPRATQCMWGV